MPRLALTRPFSSIVPFLMIGVAVWLVVFVHVSREWRQGRERYLETQVQTQDTAWRAVLKVHQTGMRAYFETHLTRPEVLHHLGRAGDPEQEVEARMMLYRLVWPLYATLSERGQVQQLHFHTPDGNSFLRFHAPHHSGDAVAEKRYSIRVANEELRAVSGFEAGSFASGFRNVFPVVAERIHLGSVELSQPFNALRAEMVALVPQREFLFLVNGPLVHEMLFPEQRRLYDVSVVHPQWFEEDPFRELPHAPPPHSDTVRELQRVLAGARGLDEALENGVSRAFPMKHHGRFFTAVVTAIPDIQGRNAAALVSFAPAPELQQMRNQFGFNMVIATLLLVIITGFFLHLAFQRRKTVVEKNRLQAITGTMGEGLYVADNEGILSFVNPEASELLGYSSEELIGTNGHDLFHRHHRNDHPASRCPILLSVQAGQVYRKQEYFRRNDGTVFPVEVTATPMMHNQTVIGAVTVFRDISERRKVEADLQRAMNAAEAANIAKSRFLATMSHELRTPFNGIMGMLQLLETTGLDDEQREYVEEAIVSSRRFVNLLGSILDFSSMETGEIQVGCDACDLQEMLDATATVFGGRARQNGLDFRCTVHEDTPRAVMGDTSRVRQVLFCLLDNAVKFTPAGNVQLSVAPEPPEPSKPPNPAIRMVFTISDTGIGIPEETLSELFRPFTQLDSSITRLHQGAGLGLVIASGLVELMKGTLTVTSEVGIGTTVHVTIPFRELHDIQQEHLV